MHISQYFAKFFHSTTVRENKQNLRGKFRQNTALVMAHMPSFAMIDEASGKEEQQLAFLAIG